MVNIRKKLIALSLTAAMGISAVPVQAVWVDVTNHPVEEVVTETVPEKRTMTIDEAIEYAKEHSYSITALEAAKAYAEAQKAVARQDLRNYQKSKVEIVGVSYLLATGYLYRSACFGYRSAERAIIQGEYELESSVSNSFYSYLSNQNKKELAEDALNTAKERLMFAETKYKNGTISANDLESFKLAVTEAENNVNKAERTLSLSMRSFKNTINYPQEGELIITGSFERQPVDDTLPDEAAKKAENSISRINNEESLALAKFKYDRSIGYYTANTVNGRSAKTEYAQTELTYKNTINQSEYSIYSAYNAMVTAYEGLSYLDASVALTERQLEAAKKQYDLGLMTATDYLSSVQQYNTLKNTIADTELNAYLAKEAYRQTYGYTNTVVQEDDPLL